MHEAKSHDANCFITLTYNDLHNPENLIHRDFQLFMKRLRKKYGENIRFYMCGEYGAEHARPHYHACLFGIDFLQDPDKKPIRKLNGHTIYRSPLLEELWTHHGASIGYSSVGTLTFDSAAYVARYIMKKVNGDLADEHYLHQSFITGELFKRKPEYTNMSRASGIGKQHFNKYSSEIYNQDFCIVNGKKQKPPKYYDNLYEISHPDELKQIKKNRQDAAKLHLDNNTPDRLRVREAIQLRRLSKLPRNLN